MAKGVSDDGQRVVGEVFASSTVGGFPPPTAFLWTPEGGAIALDDLLEANGIAPRELLAVTAISPDGDRIVAAGVVQPGESGTPSVLLEFQPVTVGLSR